MSCRLSRGQLTRKVGLRSLGGSLDFVRAMLRVDDAPARPRCRVSFCFQPLLFCGSPDHVIRLHLELEEEKDKSEREGERVRVRGFLRSCLSVQELRRGGEALKEDEERGRPARRPLSSRMFASRAKAFAEVPWSAVEHPRIAHYCTLQEFSPFQKLKSTSKSILAASSSILLLAEERDGPACDPSTAGDSALPPRVVGGLAPSSSTREESSL